MREQEWYPEEPARLPANGDYNVWIAGCAVGGISAAAFRVEDRKGTCGPLEDTKKSRPGSTNMRCLIGALSLSLESIGADSSAIVFTNSEYVRDVTQKLAQWEIQGWENESGPVANLDIVKRIHKVIKARRLVVEMKMVRKGSKTDDEKTISRIQKKARGCLRNES